MPHSLRVLLLTLVGTLVLALPGPLALGHDGPPPDLPPAAADGPNVLLFLTDDMSVSDLRYLPHVRKLLVEQGMTFTEAQSPHPLCCPARAELLSGQYAQNNGVHHNSGAFGGWRAFDPSSTLATWAQERGYATAVHGKHLNHFDPAAPADPGWTNFDILLEPATDYENFTFHGGDSYADDYVTTRLDERTVADLEGWAGPRPFLVLANHVAPHIWFPASERGDGDGDRGGRNPLAEPKYARAFRGLVPTSFAKPNFNEADMRDKERKVRDRPRLSRRDLAELNRARLRALRSVDDAVAHAVAALRRTGELDDTYIVFTSDNGYALGEHRYTGKDKLSDEVLDVPLVVRGPGIAAGTTSARQVSLVDLTATLTSLMSLSPDSTLDGEDFTATLRDAAVRGRRDTMLIQTGGKDPRARQAGWTYRGVLTRRYAYGRRVNDGLRDGFLYDRAEDPYELDNLIADPRYAAVRRELEHRLRTLRSCVGSGCNLRFGAPPAPRRR